MGESSRLSGSRRGRVKDCCQSSASGFGFVCCVDIFMSCLYDAFSC